MEIKVLELFSGIGGMHYALKSSGLAGHVVAAVDINTVANAVYQHNFPDNKVHTNNIQKLSVKWVEKLNANTILMSPPCQPHTRQGLQRDIEDKRSDALQHICSILPDLKNIEFVLMENVKCFEVSQARNAFIEALSKAGFYYREFILSPTQFGIPNTRHRYYCIARRNKDFGFPAAILHEAMPSEFKQNWAGFNLSDILLPNDDLPASVYLSSQVLLKRIWIMDIAHSKSKNTMCFTKAYTHYHEGTGSVYSALDSETLKSCFEKLKQLEDSLDNNDSDDFNAQRLALIDQLHIRYFTPTEVARLMCFPDNFQFPAATTTRQQYRLLGNSINVRVVSELIKLLCST